MHSALKIRTALRITQSLTDLILTTNCHTFSKWHHTTERQKRSQETTRKLKFYSKKDRWIKSKPLEDIKKVFSIFPGWIFHLHILKAFSKLTYSRNTIAIAEAVYKLLSQTHILSFYTHSHSFQCMCHGCSLVSSNVHKHAGFLNCTSVWMSVWMCACLEMDSCVSSRLCCQYIRSYISYIRISVCLLMEFNTVSYYRYISSKQHFCGCLEQAGG